MQNKGVDNVEKLTGIIDRFQGKYAICELDNLEFRNILRDKLPKLAKEGDSIVIEGDKITLDIEKTNERKKYMQELTKDFWM